jgi:tRNA A-37 threonylcarbamoyl transferase component Bud32
VSFLIDTVLQILAEKKINACPNQRIIPIEYDEKAYYIKRKISNGRNALIKQNTAASFWCEAYKIMMVNQYFPLAPHIIFMSDDYFIMDAAGKTLQHIAKEPEYTFIRNNAFAKAGEALALLHSTGLHHGRPALHDIAYKRETNTITLLDWENERHFFSVDMKALDIFLFIHSCFREEWSTTQLIDIAVTAYLSVKGSAEQIMNVKQFVRHHAILFQLCRELASFGWINVTAVNWTRNYIEKI